MTKSFHFVSCFLYSSIIDNMFNPSSSSVEYSCNTHIEVCDDIAAHLKRDSSNFLTDVGLQGFNGLWVVVVVIAPSFFILIICRCWASNTFIFPIFCSNQKKSVCLQLLRIFLCFVFRSFRKSFFHVFARLLITL